MNKDSQRPKLFIYLLFTIIVTVFIGGVLIALYMNDNAGGIKDVTVTNLTANGASISWTTDDYSKGNVIYSTENTWQPLFLVKNGKMQMFDDRDTAQISDGSFILNNSGEMERKTHHITLRNLIPETTYYFKVGNGSRYFDGNIISFTTSKVLEELKTPDPIYQSVGNFVEGELEPGDGVIYYFVYDSKDETKRSNLYSSVLNGENHNWTGDLGLILGNDGNYFKVDKASYKVEVYGKTEVGTGVGYYDLDEYQPLTTLEVNVRYVAE